MGGCFRYFSFLRAAGQETQRHRANSYVSWIPKQAYDCSLRLRHLDVCRCSNPFLFTRSARDYESCTTRFGLKLFSVQLTAGGSSRLSTSELILLTIFGVIAVPVLEEFLFRGYVLKALAELTGTFSAIFLTSLIFASIHVVYGAGMVAYALVLSLVLSAIVLISSNLYPAILAHSLINFFGFILRPVMLHLQARRST
jgi:membrane protease YdiL (CAAX protease family)